MIDKVYPRHWRGYFVSYGRGLFDGYEEANKRILKLERENAELRKANDILKDALGFFAKDRKK